jgi:hypothetical protein
MFSQPRMKQLLLALLAVGVMGTLTACGGSSSNVSPGQIVVGGPDEPNEPTDPNTPVTPPPSGNTIASVIPASLSDAIYSTGETTPGGKPVYIIDVAKLPGGVLNPAGLKLGNDFVFRIEGGALRIAQN